MHKILVTEYEEVKEFSDALQILEKEGCKVVKSLYPPPVKEEELLRIIKGIDALVTGGDEVTARVIEAADKLKVIAKIGVGVDKIDVEAATRKNIPVAIAPNQNGVADHAFGLLLSLARRICQANELVKSGEWEKVVGSDIWQKTLGIIGAGRIGQAVIRRARGFEMRVLAYDIHEDEKAARKLGFEYTCLEEVLQESDFISLHCPLNNTTRGLLSKERIRLMKPSAYLINTARTQIVDEDALYEALKSKEIAGAAIDVYSKVPPRKDSPLFALDNVIATPWIASYTPKTMGNMALTCAKNILRVLKGESPLYAVNAVAKGEQA